MMRSSALSQSANNPRLGLIGNPENRRIRDFQRTVQEIGYPAPPCLSYEELLREPESLARFDADLIRIDSPGENENVARALIARGGGPANAALEFGEIVYLREYYRGLCALLETIAQKN